MTLSRSHPVYFAIALLFAMTLQFLIVRKLGQKNKSDQVVRKRDSSND